MTPSSPSKSHRSRTADLLIIGAGVIGAAIAASAVRRGLSVTVVDRGAIPGFGSTSSSAGIARVHAGDVESSILADESITAWERWRELTEVPEGDAAVRFERCGTYILDDGSGMTDHVMKVMDAAGVAFSELDGDQLEEALPWADTRRFGGPCRPEDPQFWGAPEGRIERAVHTPSSGYVADPALAAQNLAAYAQRHGVQFRMGERVVAVKGEAPALDIRLESGESLAAAAVVNAAGPASQQVNAMLGVGKDFTVGQRLIRHELHHVELPAMQGPTAHIVDGDLGINFRPEGTGGFLVGSSGAPIDGEETLGSPDIYTARPTREIWYRHVSRASCRIPGLRIPAKPTGVAGVYDVTDDWLPIYDRTDRPGIFVAVGTSGNQFKTAPMVGELMADLITAAFEGRDTDEDRFVTRLPYSGRQIDTSVFSRRRTPKAGGSRG